MQVQVIGEGRNKLVGDRRGVQGDEVFPNEVVRVVGGG